MTYFLLTIIVFLVQIYLFLSWFRSLREEDSKDKLLCLLGFLLGQIYLLWEIAVVKQTGKPLPGSIEQKALMARILLGGSMGGIFTILGLFYLSFGSFEALKKTRQKHRQR
ncbi:MAG: hypothetical protein HC812_10495 [Leptolyngbya sp. RL_3_1]|nr:hypothetical protein [Leptolyngbya sp. RL_3_1]